jgi:hypothetical protein
MNLTKIRIAKVGGKRINVSKVPPIAILRFKKLTKKMIAGGLVDTSQIFEDMLEIASMICVKQVPEMTKDWLIDNLDFVQSIKFIKYIFEPYTSEPVGRNLITQATNQKYVGNGPLAKLFDLGRKLEEAVLSALQSVFFRRITELPPVNENYKNAHKIALEDRNIQWIFASFRSKRRREEEPLVSVSDFFSYSVGGGCLACL